MRFKAKIYSAPQIKIGRNNTIKYSAKAGEPIDLISSYTLGDELKLSDDGKYIIIGNNVNSVRITAQAQFAVTNTLCTLSIRKIDSDNSSDSMIAVVTGTGTAFTLNTQTVNNVKKGDKIYMASSNDALINNGSGGGLRTGLIVEKIA